MRARTNRGDFFVVVVVVLWASKELSRSADRAVEQNNTFGPIFSLKSVYRGRAWVLRTEYLLEYNIIIIIIIIYDNR